MRYKFLSTVCAIALLSSVGSAIADIKIGIILSSTGSSAGFTRGARAAVDLWPKEIAGEKVELIILDDRSDVTTSTSLVRRLVTDHNIDLIVGPNLTPAAVAAAPIVAETEVPNFAGAPVPLTADKNKWVFNITMSPYQPAVSIIQHMAKNNIKTVGLIGYSDSWGDQWVAAITNLGKEHGIKLIMEQRYGRADTSVTGQVLRLVQANPDAILVAASYAGAALPQLALKEYKYAGQIYQTQGIDKLQFMKVAGSAAEGVVFPTGPALLAEALPDNFPTKAKSVKLVKAYENVMGHHTVAPAAAHIYDVPAILEVAIPLAKLKAKPGTPEFRPALRDALETMGDVVGGNAVITFTPTNHDGVGYPHNVLMATIKDGQWVPILD